jgi:hypothetical protein
LPSYARATLAYFLKKDFNVLPLYCNGVNYNIKLTAKNTLLSSLLYSMLLKQLKLVKAYLDNYLQKEFITYSNAAYASLVLFIKKLGRR